MQGGKNGVLGKSYENTVLTRPTDALMGNKLTFAFCLLLERIKRPGNEEEHKVAAALQYIHK